MRRVRDYNTFSSFGSSVSLFRSRSSPVLLFSSRLFLRAAPSNGSPRNERPYLAFVTMINRGCIITYGNDY